MGKQYVVDLGGRKCGWMGYDWDSLRACICNNVEE